MKNWYNVARSLGERACRSIVSGGFDAAYAASSKVGSDADARSMRAACFAFLHRKAPKVAAQAATIKVASARKSVGVVWLAELLSTVKAMSLAAAQAASGKPAIKTCVVVSLEARQHIAARKRATWAAINGFSHFGYKADMSFRRTRNVVWGIANAIVSAKDVVDAGISAAHAWIVANQA